MRRGDFEAMVREMTRDLPPEFLEGIAGIEVTGKTVPHPVRGDIYTMGECLPHTFGAPDDGGPLLRSTIFLHYGSFAALAEDDAAFDWRQEAWDTLTHELRHHLEWRAHADALEAFDDAVEANYARHDGEPFPPLFFLDGERIAPGVTKVEDDVFVDVPLSGRAWKQAAGGTVPVRWHGRAFTLPLPQRLPDILFVTVQGVTPEPTGDLVVVVRRKPGVKDVFRRPTVERRESGVER